MKVCIVGDCPVCVGASELIALKDKENLNLLFYCHGCGVAWDKVPNQVDTVYSVEIFAPNGPILVLKEDLIAAGITDFKVVVDNFVYSGESIMATLSKI